MKRQDFEKLKNSTPAELAKELGDFRGKLMQLRKNTEAGKAKNIKEISLVRKDVARILTLIRQKQLTTNN